MSLILKVTPRDIKSPIEINFLKLNVLKAPWIIVLLLVYLLTGCGNDDDFGQEPCPFAPSDSNFPEIETRCDECFFNLNFQDGAYQFNGNQVDLDVYSYYSLSYNAFLSFYLISPSSVAELDQGIDVKTPLLEIETVNNLTTQPPSVSAAFGIYN